MITWRDLSMGFLGLFKNKEKLEKKRLSNKEMAFIMAHNVFDDIIMADEQIEHALSGKGDAEKLLFSTGILATTPKRALYYFQDGNKTGTETIMYDKILSLTTISGYEAKMGSYIGVAVELANGKQRVVRCLDKPEFKDMIKEIIFYIESKR
jgi:hypothetical protein